MDTTTKTVQDIQLDLIERTTLKNFDGVLVKKDLMQHRDLWKGAIMGGFEDYLFTVLRDIEFDVWSVETLLITPQKGREQEMLKLVKRWNPDELDLIPGNMIGRADEVSEDKVIHAWWDSN